MKLYNTSSNRLYNNSNNGNSNGRSHHADASSSSATPVAGAGVDGMKRGAGAAGRTSGPRFGPGGSHTVAPAAVNEDDEDDDVHNVLGTRSVPSSALSASSSSSSSSSSASASHSLSMGLGLGLRAGEEKDDGLHSSHVSAAQGVTAPKPSKVCRVQTTNIVSRLSVIT